VSDSPAARAAPPGSGRRWRLATVLGNDSDRCALLDDILAGPDEAIAEGRLLKHDGTTTVAVVSGAGRRWVVKRYNTKNHWHAVRRLVRTSRAQICWRAAGWLADIGIDTARPVAVLEERRWRCFRGRSFFICEFIGGETLVKALEREASEHLVQRASDIVLRLREAGIVHGDLKATNFVVSGDNIYLVDLDAVRRASGRRLQSGLRKDLERFLRNWARHPDLRRRFEARLVSAKSG